MRPCRTSVTADERGRITDSHRSKSVPPVVPREDVPAGLLLPIQLRKGPVNVRLFSVVSTIGAAIDVTLQDADRAYGVSLPVFLTSELHAVVVARCAEARARRRPHPMSGRKGAAHEGTALFAPDVTFIKWSGLCYVIHYN